MINAKKPNTNLLFISTNFLKKFLPGLVKQSSYNRVSIMQLVKLGLVNVDFYLKYY